MSESPEDYNKTNDQDNNVPYNDLDMQYKTTNPAWGREATQYLADALTVKKEDEQDNEKNWELLAYYTRDMRLANLGTIEVIVCNKYLGIAGDCLRQGWKKSFITSLSRVIDILELSQSKAGFLRRRHGTFTKEQVNRDDATNKKLFGGKRQEA